MAQVHASVIHSVLGEPEQARQDGREALELARRIRHLHTLAYALHYTALGCQLRRDARGTLLLAEECHALAREHGFRLWLVWSALLCSWALGELGQPAEALALMRQWLEQWRATGIRAGMPHNLGMLAELHLKQGQVPEALEALREGLEWVEAVGERSYEAPLHRLRGEALRRLGREEEARECLQHALRLAQAQGALGYARHVQESLGPSPPEAGQPREEAPRA
jgi:tetratricopeptide (TPR) repeat protein